MYPNVSYIIGLDIGNEKTMFYLYSILKPKKSIILVYHT